MAKVFVCADLHLNHARIIELCNRPFKDVDEMNDTLIANWNSVVDKEDTIYFLGDLCFETKEKSKDYWLSKLNGHIIWVKGNHDHYKRLIKTIYFNEYVMVHDPNDVELGWKLCIHGHCHNKVPRIDRRRKRICVSVELIDYTPIELNKLMEEYENGERKS